MRIGVDIGGTSIKAGILWAGEVKSFCKLPTGKTKQAFLDSLIELIRAHLGGHVIGIGIGCPGPANYPLGIIRKTPNLPIQDFNLKHYLKRFFKTDIVIENDAACFTLAEAKFGAGKGKHLVLGLTLGTGVGGGIVHDGKLLRGQGNAGHFSRLILSTERAKPSASFEMLCNERALISDTSFKTAEELFAAAKKGNKPALKTFSEYGHVLGLGIGSLISAFDPDVFVVGGGLSNFWKFFESEMHKAIKEVTPFKAQVVRSRLQNAGIIGAASLIRG